MATLAELYNNWGIAYAMLKTGRYVEVPERKMPSELTPLELRFRDAIRAFESLKCDQQRDWAERTRRRYPSLAEIVAAID